MSAIRFPVDGKNVYYLSSFWEWVSSPFKGILLYFWRASYPPFSSMLLFAASEFFVQVDMFR